MAGRQQEGSEGIYPDQQPPSPSANASARPAFHAGVGRAGSMTCHSASLMSEGYRGIRVLLLIPPGQHRHGTAEVA